MNKQSVDIKDWSLEYKSYELSGQDDDQDRVIQHNLKLRRKKLPQYLTKNEKKQLEHIKKRKKKLLKKNQLKWI